MWKVPLRTFQMVICTELDSLEFAFRFSTFRNRSHFVRFYVTHTFHSYSRRMEFSPHFMLQWTHYQMCKLKNAQILDGEWKCVYTLTHETYKFALLYRPA